MKKIIKIFVYLSFAFLLIYNITVMIQKVCNPNEIPNFLGYKNFVILSGSMEDTLNIGDIIFIKDKSEIKNGDIISYREKQAVITHRVIDIIEQNGEIFYKTKGDANETIDKELVSIDEIEGIYCFKIAKMGTIIMFLQSKTGIMTFLVILLVLYIFTNKTSKSKEKKGKHSM